MSRALPPRLGTAIVIAKEPRPGRVKTRLTPALTTAEAARLAAAALTDTLRAVSAVPAARRLLAFAGDASAWTLRGWDVVPQPAGGLDVRLAAAFTATASTPGPAVLVGMDTPQLRPTQLAFDARRYDACLGLAADGGFWAIGFADPTLAAEVIPGVPMSTAHTGQDQLTRLRERGLRVQLLDELTDVDTVDTAREVAQQAPHTDFARAWANCSLPVAG